MFMRLTREKLNKIVTRCLRSLGNKSRIFFFSGTSCHAARYNGKIDFNGFSAGY